MFEKHVRGIRIFSLLFFCFSMTVMVDFQTPKEERRRSLKVRVGLLFCWKLNKVCSSCCPAKQRIPEKWGSPHSHLEGNVFGFHAFQRSLVYDLNLLVAVKYLNNMVFCLEHLQKAKFIYFRFYIGESFIWDNGDHIFFYFWVFWCIKIKISLANAWTKMTRNYCWDCSMMESLESIRI